MVRVAHSQPWRSSAARAACMVCPVAQQSSTSRMRLPSGGGPIHAVAPVRRSQPIMHSGNASMQAAIVAGTRPPRRMATTASGCHAMTPSSSAATIRSAWS